MRSEKTILVSRYIIAFHLRRSFTSLLLSQVQIISATCRLNLDVINTFKGNHLNNVYNIESDISIYLILADDTNIDVRIDRFIVPI